MSDNIVVASFTDARHETRTRRVYQYDYGMVLTVDGITLPTAFEAHFSNQDDTGTSVTQIGSDGAVTIPDAYLLTGLPVYCWIYLHSGEDDGETVYKITIPVKKRAQPTNETPTPVQQDAITQAIAALNSAVTQTGQDAESAEASASDAADSAEEAKGYKEDAETAAGNAAQSATEAAASATTASQKATRAGNFMIDAGRSAEVAEEDARIASQSANTARIQAQSAQASAQAAQTSAQSIQSMNVEAETLAPGSQATAEWSDGTLSLGIPRGDKGLKGDPGDPGDPGFSPTASVSKSGNATTLTVTDKTGTTTATILDGAKGDPGDPGTSPTASVSKSGNKSTITITDEEGTTTAEVLDGVKGDPGVSPTVTVTDITGGHRITITDADHPQGISFDVMDGSDADAPVQDVTLDGVSIVDAQGNAAIPLMGTNVLGVAQTNGSNYGIGGTQAHVLYIVTASDAQEKTGIHQYRPIVPYNQHYAAFYGLAKIAGADEKNSTLSAGQYTENAKSKIHEMLSGSISVSGTTPTINALPGLRYICGECSTLTVNLPASGCVDIQFESGSTPTVLTVVPASGQTVTFPAWFDDENLEADTVYEMSFADGYGAVMSWQA